VRLEGKVAWVTTTFTSRGMLGGRDVDQVGEELMVLVHGADGWHIASIHWSSRPSQRR
jgi:hypothetical protein